MLKNFDSNLQTDLSTVFLKIFGKLQIASLNSSFFDDKYILYNASKHNETWSVQLNSDTKLKVLSTYKSCPSSNPNNYDNLSSRAPQHLSLKAKQWQYSRSPLSKVIMKL